MATIVRYADASGINVRSKAAGSVVTTINGGNLMYDIAGVAKVTKALNGTSYVWVKVHYYKVANSTEEGDGWVAESNTTVVSTTVPTKSKVLTSNSKLKQYESLINARYIFKALYKDGKGWSSNAIYGMLGNMEEESYINPGKWEVTNDTTKGYGLTQWTPATNYINSLPSGAEKSDIDNQLNRILTEVTNEKLQWNKNLHSPTMTFAEYSKSSKTVAVLAEYFLRCYEKPGSVSTKVETRQTNAKKWATLINYLLK